MDSQSPQLSVILRPAQLQVLGVGPGRLLTKFYLEGGLFIGHKFGCLAHKLGLGPDAVAKQIWEQAEKDGKLLKLTNLSPEAREPV